jgi:hypothetical protein
LPEKSCFIDICCVSKPYSLNISVEFSPPSVTGKNDDLILLYLHDDLAFPDALKFDL